LVEDCSGRRTDLQRRCGGQRTWPCSYTSGRSKRDG
jgi:hypothetical protein